MPEQLEKLYQQFNLEKPVDFHSTSMSVSDISDYVANPKKTENGRLITGYAVSYTHLDVYKRQGEAIGTSIPADPNVKNYSYVIVDGQVYYLSLIHIYPTFLPQN